MINKLLVTTALSLLLTTTAAHVAERNDARFLEPTAGAGYASDIIGATVYDRTGNDAQSIGEINDLLVQEDGMIPAAIIGVGGFLGVGEKDVAVSFDALEITTDADGNRYVILSATREELEAAPAFGTDVAMAPATTGEEVAPATQDQLAAEQPADEQVTGTTTTDQAAVEPRVAPDRQGMRAAEAATFTADNLIGVTVYSADNENIGSVSDVILSKDGSDGAIEAVVLDIGGFLGIGAKPVAVSFDSLEIMVDEGNDLYAYSKFTQAQLEAAAEYDPDTYEVNRETMLVRPQG